MKSKRLVALVLANLMILSFVGCGKSQTTSKTEPAKTEAGDKKDESKDAQSSDSNKDKKKVVFWGGQFGSTKIFDRFKEETGWDYDYPVNFVDNAKLIAAIASGAPPDAAFIYMNSVPQLASSNALRPLDDLIKGTDFKWEDHYDWAVNLGIYNDKHYALNWDLNTQVLYYNKKMFEQAGLDPEKPPKTWKELYDYAKLLTKFDDKGNLTQIGFQSEWWKESVLAFQEEAIKDGWKLGSPYDVKENTPERAEIWDLIKSLYQLHGGDEGVNKAKNAGAQFGLEFNTTAMKLDDCIWPYSVYMDQYPDLEFGIATVPSKEGTKNALGMDATWALVMPVKSSNPEGGFEVCKWFATKALFNGEKKGFEADPSKYYSMPLANKQYTETIMKEYLPNITNDTLKNREINKFNMILKLGKPTVHSPVDFGKTKEELWKKFFNGEISSKEALAQLEEKDKKAVENFIKEKKAMGIWKEDKK